MGKINIAIDQYKVEGFEFAIKTGKAVLTFDIGLYVSGNKITTVTFSNDEEGIKFIPTKKINNLSRQMLIVLDEWIEKNYFSNLS